MTYEESIQQNIEEIALFFEAGGLPRISGRVVGHLLVCNPAHSSAAQLSDELQASRASISNMTRLLLTARFIEKVSFPGDRTTYYRISSDGFESHFQTKVDSVSSFCSIIERAIQQVERHTDSDSDGVAPTAAPSPGNTDRLRELLAMYKFLEEELPQVFARWQSQRQSLIAATYDSDDSKS